MGWQGLSSFRLARTPPLARQHSKRSPLKVPPFHEGSPSLCAEKHNIALLRFAQAIITQSDLGLHLLLHGAKLIFAVSAPGRLLLRYCAPACRLLSNSRCSCQAGAELTG
jgi:hypothetical protein